MIRTLAIICALAAIVPFATFGQDAGGDDGGDRRGRRGNWDPEQMRAMMDQRTKESLGSTDEEWALIKPLIDEVRTKQWAVRELSSRGGGWGRRGRRGGDEEQTQPTEVTELEAAIKAEDGAAITQKLTALRAARLAREAELKDARAALVEVLTPAQEATLVLQGMLE